MQHVSQTQNPLTPHNILKNIPLIGEYFQLSGKKMELKEELKKSGLTDEMLKNSKSTRQAAQTYNFSLSNILTISEYLKIQRRMEEILATLETDGFSEEILQDKKEVFHQIAACKYCNPALS